MFKSSLNLLLCYLFLYMLHIYNCLVDVLLLLKTVFLILRLSYFRNQIYIILQIFDCLPKLDINLYLPFVKFYLYYHFLYSVYSFLLLLFFHFYVLFHYLMENMKIVLKLNCLFLLNSVFANGMSLHCI